MDEDNFFAACRLISFHCLLAVAGGAGFPANFSPESARVQLCDRSVFPHDTSAYTQGLAYRDGFLYEGTGLNGRSSLRKVRLETGEVVQRVDLGAEFFGEGITIVKDRVLQLTWTSEVGFVYDLNSFHVLRKFSYSGQGWGLAANRGEFF